LRRHGRQARDASTAQQLQQDGFRLVIAMLREDQDIGIQTRKGLISRLPRCGLQTKTAMRPDVDRFNGERNTQVLAQTLAKNAPRGSVRTDAMIDVQGAERKTSRGGQLGEKIQEDDRIDAPGEAHYDASSSSAVRRKRLRDGCREFSRGPFP
jgi:hypothetical protein